MIVEFILSHIESQDDDEFCESASASTQPPPLPLHGMNALMTASAVGNVEVFDVLLSHTSIEINAIHKFAGNTAEEVRLCNTALHFAVEMDKPQVIKSLCKAGADCLIQLLSTFATPLHLAAQKGASKETIFALTRFCACSVSALLNNDTTPLYLAAQEGHVEALSALLLEGADPNYAMPVINHRLPSSTMVLVKTNTNNDVGSDLLYINSQIGNGAAAIHAAAENGHPIIVKALIEKGANINSLSIGVSALHLAVQYNQLEVIKILLTYSSLNINIRSRDDGSTPLYSACGSGNRQIVETLLNSNASLRISHKSGVNPFLYAILQNHVEVVAVLLKHMQKTNNEDLNWLYSPAFKNRAAAPLPLHAAVSTGNVELVKQFFLDQEDSIETMMLLAFDPADSDTVLHTCVRHVLNVHESVRMLSFLLKLIITKRRVLVSVLDTKTRTDFGTALHFASIRAGEGAEELVSLLLVLEAGAQVDVRMSPTSPSSYANNNNANHNNNAGSPTSLYLAAQVGNDRIVKLLLDTGADPNVRLDPPYGSTPLLGAIEKNHLRVVKILLESSSHDKLATDVELGNGAGGIAQSPLLLAVMRGGRAEIVDLLLHAGAMCNILVATAPSRTDSITKTAASTLIEVARFRRDYDTLQVLSRHDVCLNVKS